MSTTISNTHLKQVKASTADRINGKVKIQNKQDSNSNVTTGSTPNGTPGKVTNGLQPQQQAEGLSPEQRRRVSGRPQMTAEEQRLALRKRVKEC
jgi:hypothetical protein